MSDSCELKTRTQTDRKVDCYRREISEMQAKKKKKTLGSHTIHYTIQGSVCVTDRKMCVNLCMMRKDCVWVG